MGLRLHRLPPDRFDNLICIFTDMKDIFTPDMRLSDMIDMNYTLMQVMSRMGVGLSNAGLKADGGAVNYHDGAVPEGEGGRHGAGAEKCLGPAPL